MNLKTIVNLENKENFKLPEDLQKSYDGIIGQEQDFINGIPLPIIEKYYLQKQSNLNSYVNILHNEKELNLKVNEIFIKLENFYQEIFLLASLIANYYNLEIKINTENDNNYA